MPPTTIFLAGGQSKPDSCGQQVDGQRLNLRYDWRSRGNSSDKWPIWINSLAARCYYCAGWAEHCHHHHNHFMHMVHIVAKREANRESIVACCVCTSIETKSCLTNHFVNHHLRDVRIRFIAGYTVCSVRRVYPVALHLDEPRYSELTKTEVNVELFMALWKTQKWSRKEVLRRSFGCEKRREITIVEIDVIIKSTPKNQEQEGRRGQRAAIEEENHIEVRPTH